MSSKKFLPAILITIVLIITASFGINYYQKTTKKPSPSPTPFPTPTPMSKPAPAQLTTIEGTITSLNKTSLTINTSVGSQTFSLVGTKDFRRIISGTVGKGDTKKAPSSISELKVGQEVLITYPINSTSALSVYIIK